MSTFRSLVAAVIVAVSVAVVEVVVVATPAAAASVVLSPPTDAPVLDPFRLPDGPYGAGNRGIEYDTGAEEIVRAAADGVVAFAGQVGGNLFVSVDHPGGMRTTYGFVGRVGVRRGSRVVRGDVVAITDGPFHFTVRIHGRYIDPAPMFGVIQTSVRLIPHRVRFDSARYSSRRLIEPRTVPHRDRRNHWVRASPGRLGVPHEHATGKEENHGSHLHEAAVGGRRSLRPPDPPLEPEDEAVHPRRAVRHPHRGSPPDAQPPRELLRLRA